MNFLWLDLDDPKGSMRWSLLAILIGVVLATSYMWISMLIFLLRPATLPMSEFVWEYIRIIVGLGVTVFLIGLLTLALSTAAWLASLHRGYD